MLPGEAPHALALHGAVSLAAPSEVDALAHAALANGWLRIDVPSPARAARGSLAEHVEAAIDARLAARGAPPPGASCAESMDAALSDQLFRARLAGQKGLLLVVGSLAPVAVHGCLDPRDGETLAWLASATRDRPVSLVLSADAREHRAYGPSVPLTSLLAIRAPVDEPREVAAEDDDGAMLERVDALEATTGARPLAEVERVFVEAYAPLVEHASQGSLPERAAAAVARWAAGFAKSYTEAHPAFRVTHKRPPMVLDLPRLAAKIARLHGARAVELVLVDALRFDLGERVTAQMSAALEGRATLAERLLLWAALPTTTTTQLVTFAGGLDALLAGADEPDAALVARSERAAALRRVRVAGRDVFKLDAIEARLAEPGLDHVALDAACRRAADALAKHVAQRAERTLVVVFGDHGFKLDASQRPLTSSQGGASPEEVLVPAYAWLVGGVHLRARAATVRRTHRTSQAEGCSSWGRSSERSRPACSGCRSPGPGRHTLLSSPLSNSCTPENRARCRRRRSGRRRSSCNPCRHSLPC